MFMRIAYLTTDEVNQELALRWAAGQEAQLEVIWPRDEPPDGCFDAVIYDLDCLPPPLRQQLLTDLAGGGAPWPAAVHSYALEGEQIKALLGRGVIVRRRLRATLFRRLSAAVRTKSNDGQLPQAREIDLQERLAPEPD
jgi:hypothetical protein